MKHEYFKIRILSGLPFFVTEEFSSPAAARNYLVDDKKTVGLKEPTQPLVYKICKYENGEEVARTYSHNLGIMFGEKTVGVTPGIWYDNDGNQIPEPS